MTVLPCCWNSPTAAAGTPSATKRTAQRPSISLPVEGGSPGRGGCGAAAGRREPPGLPAPRRERNLLFPGAGLHHAQGAAQQVAFQRRVDAILEARHQQRDARAVDADFVDPDAVRTIEQVDRRMRLRARRGRRRLRCRTATRRPAAAARPATGRRAAPGSPRAGRPERREQRQREEPGDVASGATGRGSAVASGIRRMRRGAPSRACRRSRRRPCHARTASSPAPSAWRDRS